MVPKSSVRRPKIGEGHVRFIPIFEWQLARDTIIVSARDGRHFILHAIPLKLTCAADHGRLPAAGQADG